MLRFRDHMFFLDAQIKRSCPKPLRSADHSVPTPLSPLKSSGASLQTNIRGSIHADLRFKPLRIKPCNVNVASTEGPVLLLRRGVDDESREVGLRR